jgi:hypothetical protein
MREETEYKPKCMVEVGNKPIIKHIMEGYMRNSYRHFIMALGYKGDMIKRYFFEYPMMQHPYTISNIGAMKYHGDPMDEKDSFKVTMVDTGMESQTGERLLRLRDYITEPTFLCTYGDGLSNVDIQEVVDFHRTHGRMATLVAVQPRSKYGVLDINDRTYTDAQGYILAAERDRLMRTWSRQKLIDWLCWNDPNGLWRDKDMIANDMDPMSQDEAVDEVMAYVEEEDETPEEMMQGSLKANPQRYPKPEEFDRFLKK